MDPLKTPSSSSANDEKFKNNAPEKPQGVPPIDKSEDKPVEVAAETSKSESTAPSDTDTPSPATETESTDETPKSDAPQSPVETESVDAPSVEAPDQPDAPAAAAPVAAQPVVTGAPKSRKKALMLSVVAMAIVLLLGGAAAAYYYVLNKPETVLQMALANSFSKDKVKSVHFSGAFNVEGQGEGSQTFSTTFTGASDQKGAFDLSAKLDAKVANVTLDLRSLDGKSAFVRVGGLDGLPQLLSATGSGDVAELYAPMIAAVNNQWFEINESLIQQFTGVKESTFSDADRKKLVDTYEDHPFLVVKQKLANEKIKGVDSYHYKIVVDAEQLKKFVQAIKDAKLDSLKITDEQLKSFNDSLKDTKFDKYPVDVWISKNDKLIKQISFTFAESGATGNLRLTIDSYNNPVKVEKPEGAKSIMELLGSFYGGSAQNFDSSIPALEGANSGISL